MADEPGYRSDGDRQAPDFLTVDQTADVLQIGRSTTYELVGRFVRSAGTDGIPAIVVGGQYRIPRARLEEYAGQAITWPPPRRTRRRRPHRSARRGEDQPETPAPPAQDVTDELRAPGAADPTRIVESGLDAAADRWAANGRDVGAESIVADAADHAVPQSAEDRSDVDGASTNDDEAAWDASSDSQSTLPFEG